MDALSAIRSLAELQAKFNPEISFDPETILALANECEKTGSLEVDVSSPAGIEYSYESSSSAPAQLFDYRDEKVAGFEINGTRMICLPQVYELFLKNMVGGLHTVYTKLKRLEISPLICNVEQVRALRGLGAIQPGVNRCKLISITDFDKLYEDCTNTCTRPGRPPKRVLTGGLEDWPAVKKESGSSSSTAFPPSSTSPAFMATEELTQQAQSQQCVPGSIFMPNFLPQFTHQLLLQHVMAMGMAAQQQQQQTEITQSSSTAEDADSDLLSTADLGASNEPATPLNLTKTNTNSETGDSDSLESMRKVDASLSPSQYNSERGGSSSGSNGSNNSPSAEATSAALNKIITLVDMANEHFKQQREQLTRERTEISQLQSQLHQSLRAEDRWRSKLDYERKKSNLFFRRYCKARREVIELKEQLLQFRSRQQNGDM